MFNYQIKYYSKEHIPTYTQLMKTIESETKQELSRRYDDDFFIFKCVPKPIFTRRSTSFLVFVSLSYCHIKLSNHMKICNSHREM